MAKDDRYQPAPPARATVFSALALAKPVPKTVKVALVGGSFPALIARPFCFEFGGGHGGVANSASFSRIGMANECALKIWQRQCRRRNPGRVSMIEI
jgi:hypothetical protein